MNRHAEHAVAEAGRAGRAELRSAVGWVVLGAIGLPLSWWGLSAAGRGDLRVAASATGAVVLLAALLSLLPMVLTRHAGPAVREVSGRLMQVVLRLVLTAGGLVLVLLSLPDGERALAGLIGLGWYAVSWGIGLVFLIPERSRSPRQSADESLHYPTAGDRR